MLARQRHPTLRRLSARTLALAAAGLWLLALVAQPLSAGELDTLDSGLKLIPADAAFFVSRLHNRQQFEAVVHSKAWARVMAMPAARMVRSMYEKYASDPSTPAGKIDAALKNPEVRKLLDLLGQMGSQEVFVYGGEDVDNFLELLQDVTGALRYGPAVLQLTGQAGERTPNDLQARIVVSTLAKNLDLLDIPTLVFGFKLKNTDLAKEELIKLETFANIMLEMNERTKGRFKKAKVGAYEYLTLELDGAMLPWNMLPVEKLKEIEAEKGDVEKIVGRLKELKLVLALGLRGQYLLASIGPSTEGLARLGTGKRLIDRPELKPLTKFADKRLTSIAYVSEDMNQQLNNNAKAIDGVLDAVNAWLPTAKLDDRQRARIRKDAGALAADLKQWLPAAGASLGFGFLSPGGLEGYQRAWGEHPLIDGSKPLSLLEHVGGDPILGGVTRLKISVKDYDQAVKWLKIGYGYFREFGLPALPDDPREKLRKFLAEAVPLAARLDKANRDMLLPALADGQVAVVVDAKLKSKHFIEALPASRQPLPMLEPALVLGVSNAALLRKAGSEYRTAINGLLDAARKIEGVNLPDWLRIPEPKAIEADGRKIYVYRLPEEWGVDEQIAPHLAVSDGVAVVAMSQNHVERLLKATPLKVGGVLKHPTRPLAGAAWLRWSGLIDAARPWVNLATKQAADPQVETPVQLYQIASQAPAALEVLKVLQTVSSESYLEDQAMVTHLLLEIRDIKD